MKYNTNGVTAVVDIELSQEQKQDLADNKKTSFVTNNFSLMDIDDKTMLLELKGANDTIISIKFFK